jgi:ATP-dependent DNA helicase RecG
MRSVAEIVRILDELDTCSADDLEAQDLDFKAWNTRSMADAVDLVVEMAICMANGGGGTVVFGVDDRRVGRAHAILGVPHEIDVNRLKKAVYDSSDPKLTPVFEDVRVTEGTGRLLVMQTYPGLPPYTDTAGRGKIRVGKDCQPLTGTLRRRIMVETGETDYTAVDVAGEPRSHVSAAAMEQLRDAAQRERAPDELLRLGDFELLNALGVIRDGRLSRAGLLLAGKAASIQEHVPTYVWTHLRMQSDIAYSDRLDGRDALPVALARLTDRIMADNPITTVPHGMYHHEYRTYPEIALREALMNALCHVDYRIAGPILVKQFARRIEIGNPGGFIGGISPDNILHHPPVARNPRLVDALTRLRLINRSNLGIQRIFSALLIEGKSPPLIEDQGEAVKVIFRANEFSAPFRAFVTDEGRRERILSVDHLLILHYLLRHPELDVPTAARLCQQSEEDVRDVLSFMERDLGYLDRGGAGRGTYWILRPELHQRIWAPGLPERDRRIDWEAAKTRVLSVLMQRARRAELPLSNAEVRAITHLDRRQVKRLLDELRNEGLAKVAGLGRTAGWVYVGGELSDRE